MNKRYILFILAILFPIYAFSQTINWDLFLAKSFPDYSLSPQFFYHPTPYSILGPKDFLQSNLLSPTNQSVQTNIKQINNLTITKETWRKFIEAEKAAKAAEKQKEIDENVKRALDFNWEPMDTQLKIYGQLTLSARDGTAFYLNQQAGQRGTPNTSIVSIGPDINQDINIHISGKIGQKVKVNVDNSGRQLNTVRVDYDNSKNKKAFIQKVTAGNISVSLPGSSLASGTSGGGKEAVGVKVEAQKSKLKLQGIASLSRGMQGHKHYSGNTVPVVKDIPDYSYVRFKYYFIPQAYKPGTLKIYLDDKKGTYYEQTIDSNHCYLLSPGSDYIEEGDNLIYFKKSLTSSYDVLVSYQPLSGTLSPTSSTNYHPDYRRIITNQSVGNTNKYLYLLRGSQISPYEFKGVYNLGNRNINTSADSWKIYITTPTGQEITSISLSRDESGKLIQDDNSPYQYYLDTKQGYIGFRDNEPFSAYYKSHDKDPNDILYTYTYKSPESLLKIHVEYKYQIKEYSLGWDVIKNSETIFVDGQIQKKDIDYTIDYQTGIVRFKNIVNPDADIDIYYQYSPFGFSSQQILLGLRGDYTPTKWFNLTGVGFYSGQQRPIRIPSARSTPNEKLVGSVSGKISFTGEQLTSYFSNVGINLKKTVPIDIQGQGEIAGSLYNPNNFGNAMLEDFEGSQISRSISMDSKRFYPYLPLSSSYSTSNMGKIYYKDYYDYSLFDKRFRDFDYSFSSGDGIDPPSDRTNVSYNTKAGPYMIGENHIDAIHYDYTSYSRTKSMVIDFAFPHTSGGWISLIYNKAFDKSGANFSDYQEVDLWVKYISDNPDDTIDIKLGIGKFNEDIDHDGAPLEEEANEYSDGLTFNDPYNGKTTIGGGSHLIISGKENTENGIRDTEDLDGNRQLDTITASEEANNIFLPDPNFTSVQGGEDTQSLKLKAKGQWQLVKILIDKNQLKANDPDRYNLLETGIKNLVLYIGQRSGTKGKLLIDEIKFVGSTYNDIHVDNSINPTVSTNSNSYSPIEVSYVSTFDTPDSTSYYSNSLRNFTESDAFTKNDLYKKEKSYDDLHGALTENEWNLTEEHALSLSYFDLKNYDFSLPIELQPNTNSFVLAGRNFSSTYDLRFYKKIKLWVRVNSSDKNAWFVYRFGSSSADYYEYRINLHNMTEPWNLLTIDLRSKEFLNLTNHMYTDPDDYEQHFRIKGNPSLRAIKYIGYGVYGGDPYNSSTNTSGNLWINDNYASKLDLQTGLGYHYSGSFNLRKHVNINYAYSKRDKYFSSYGSAGSGVLSESRNISGTWSSLSWMPISANWNKSFSESDIDDITLPYNQKGRNNKDTKSISASLRPDTWKLWGKNKTYIPSFSGSYRIETSSNAKPISLEKTYYLNSVADTKSYNLTGKWTPPFLDKIKIKSSSSFSYGFSENSTKNYTYHSTNSSTNFIANPFSQSKSLSYSLSLAYKDISISPSYSYRASYDGKNQFFFTDFNPIENGYTNKESKPLRLNARSRSLNLPITLGKIWKFNPILNYKIDFSENGFSYFDLPITTTSNYTIVTRNPTSTINLSESFGSFNFKHFFITSFTPRYSRSFSFSDQQQRVFWKNGTAYFWQYLNDFGYLALIPNPLQFIPIHITSTNSDSIPKFSNMDFVSKYTDHHDSNISLNETISANIGLNILQIIKGSVSYSFSQKTSRSKNSYSEFTHTHSLRYSGGMNLMDKLKGFLFWTPSKTYTKSSSLNYSFSYSAAKDFRTSIKSFKYNPSASLNYSWKKETSASIAASYIYNKNNIFKPDTYFKKYTAYYLPELYKTLVWDNTTKRYPHTDTALNITINFKFPSNLPETWKPPFFKKSIKLDTHINHTSTLTFNNHFYKYDKEDTTYKTDDILAIIILKHSIRYDITKNIDGDLNGKLAFQSKRIKDNSVAGTLGGDTIETIAGFEIGMNLRIKF